MYKLVIAEDDELQLQGLCTIFDWNALGIELVAGVDDGDKALEAIERYQADILLTDIKMTNMDGLTLTQKAKEKNPKLTVVVMSAYDDFAFAQQAIRLSVNDYLMKPLDLELLTRRMEEIVEEKSKIDHREKEVKKLERLVHTNRSDMEESFYRNVLLNKYSKEECVSRAEEFIKIEDLSWQVVEVIFDNPKDSQDQKKVIHEIANSNEFMFLELENGQNLVCCHGHKDSLPDIISNFKQMCRNRIGELFPNHTLSFINGTVVDNLYYLNLSYEKIVQIRIYKYTEGKNVDLSESDLEKYFNVSHTLNHTVIDYLVKLTSYGNIKAIPEYVKKLKENLRNSGSESKVLLLFAVSSLLGEISKSNQDKSEFYDKYDGIYHQIITQQTLDEAMDTLEKMLVNIAEIITKKENLSNEHLVKEALQYIEEHYTESSLRISDVAKSVNLSQNYFSTIFREVVGKSFTDYLIEKRMKAAQELILHSNYRSNEIGYKVGYDNPAYFSAAFKKYAGMSISYYKKMVNSL